MNRLFICAVLLIPMSVRAADDSARRELIAVENHWLAVEDDPDALESILAPDFIHVVSAGIITKAEQLDFMRKHPAHRNDVRRFEDLRVRVYGNVGIANGIVAATGQGATKRTAFTDVFEKRRGKWLAINAQELQLSGP